MAETVIQTRERYVYNKKYYLCIWYNSIIP